jgi:DNA-binding NarL/FixJ family response regulator
VIRVLLVEDHPFFAHAVEQYLTQSGVEIVGSAQTKAEAVLLARDRSPDVLLMDYHLPDGTGAETAAIVRADSPRTVVVMLTGDETEDAMLDAVEAGASGFLSKGERPEIVRDAVERASRGEMLIDGAVLARLVATRHARAAAAETRKRAIETLTRREREVLALLAQGADNAAIATKLSVAIATVRTYVQSVIEKLGAHSKLEAVVRASELGVIGPPRSS